MQKIEFLDETPEKDFYICEDCQAKHEIRTHIPTIIYCQKCEPRECNCPKIKLGFYWCGTESYLYSIDGRQIE